MARTTKKKRWSYSAGEKGRNRVRAFEHASGVLMVEFNEAGRKRRISLGHRDKGEAKRAADEAAAKLAKAEVLKPTELTLGALFELYLGEVTPQKSEGVQAFDRAAVQRLLKVLGAGRTVTQLSRREWDLFIKERQSGRSTGKAVGPRAVARDLKFLTAVLNWATLVASGRGSVLLERNPLRGLPYPTEKNPRRPLYSQSEYESLLAAAPQVHPDLADLLATAHETGRRISAICQLRWSDIDISGAVIHWRAEHDKQGYDSVCPVSTEGLRVLKARRLKVGGIGDAQVFPSPKDPAKPMSRYLAQDWLRKAESGAGLERVSGRGWHALRRKWVTDYDGIQTPAQMATNGGWKDDTTLKRCYLKPSNDQLRQGLDQRRRVG